MEKEEFENKIREEIKELNREQLVFFAWLCAVRAFPFIGKHGNFKFWFDYNKQNYLYTLLNALDIFSGKRPSYLTNIVQKVDDIASISWDTFVVLEANSNTTNKDESLSAIDAITSIARTYVFAYSLISDAQIEIKAEKYASIASAHAFSALPDLLEIIFNDIKLIKKGKKIGYNNDLSIYGKVWNNFQKALDAEGCGYWGRLYQNIFESGFILDEDALQRRLNIPKEIQELGAAKVAEYLEELERGATRLNEARIIILGDKGSGKTCLTRRLKDPNAAMTTDEESTPGVDTSLWKPDKKNLNIHLWDFAGHTVTHAVHQFFLSERCLYVIVYNGRTEESNRLEYWLDHVKNYGGESRAIILVNERDRHKVEIPIRTLEEKYPIAGCYSFSIKDDIEDLNAFRNTIVEYIENNPSWEKQEIPTAYYQVKEELEQLFVNSNDKKAVEHITLTQFEYIAKKYDIGNNDKLLQDLNALGISLWYQNMKQYNTMVLNPEWISQGVYQIINWANSSERFSLGLCDFAQVFANDTERYTTDNYEFFFDLMKHYELAYQTQDDKCLIIPHLLKKDRPVNLPKFPIGDSLMLRYKAEQPLPPNTISRFIIRHNNSIKVENKKQQVWRHGVVLEDKKGSIALVREDDRCISVSVKGTDKTAFISTLRQTLNDIFESYKSDKPELQYRIERHGLIPEIENNSPLWLSDKKIFTHNLDNVPYYDENTRQNINLHYTVNNYKITTDTLISGQGVYNDNSTHQTFNFHDCNISLQNDLNDLTRKLIKAGNKEEASELSEVAELLDEVKDCTSPDEVKRKGVERGIKGFFQKLGDEDSKLHKTVAGVKEGICIAQDIAKTYNDFAQWVGWPQVPKPFLKKDEAK